MAVRVEDILRIPGIALRLAAGAAAQANPIRWVHVSELEDPTPWLKGGELLLTTGMGVGKTPSRQRAFVERLAAAGLAGLGFGTGFTFTKVPKALVEAADRLRFPVFEVPYPVPFIAITEAVFTRVAAEQVDVLQRSLDAQASLTRAVLEGAGVAGIVEGLAAAVGGWAVVLDLHGLPLAASPRSARARTSRLWAELRDSRPDAAGFSVSLVDRGDHVSVQPVGAGGHVAGFLVVGMRESMGQFERIVASHALSLLAIELDKSRAVAEAERRLKGDFLDALVGDSLAAKEVSRGLRRFGFEPTEDVVMVALESDAPVEQLTWAVEDALSRRDGGFLAAPRDATLLTMVAPKADIASLREEVEAKLGGRVTVGVGSAVVPGDAARSLREARYALRVCRVDGLSIATFGSLGTYRLLLTLQDADALRAFADSVLQPLDRYDDVHGGELVTSLRAFLDHNARWEPAAGQLFVHRHTLRYRMRKVEELTGRDLQSAHDRMEFWLALRARDLLERGEGS